MRVGEINKRYPPAIKGYGGAKHNVVFWMCIPNKRIPNTIKADYTGLEGSKAVCVKQKASH